MTPPCSSTTPASITAIRHAKVIQVDCGRGQRCDVTAAMMGVVAAREGTLKSVTPAVTSEVTISSWEAARQSGGRRLGVLVEPFHWWSADRDEGISTK